MKRLTVFTPSYNRAYCISKLYDSLIQQTSKDFVWLIVDDGSVDNTEELVNSFISDGALDIRYYKKQNGGKHTAHNLGVELCDTELFFCVDSDDALTEDAVDVIIKTNEKHQNDNLLGYYFRRRYVSAGNVATPYPESVVSTGITDLYHKYKFKGDTAIVLKTAYAKQYSFPVFAGERFVTEYVYYNQLNHIAPMLLCENAIYICEYLEDGYTKNARKLTANNPYGSAYAQLSEAHYDYGVIKKAKHYSQYLALIRVYSLDRSRLVSCNKVSLPVKALAILFLYHYIALYKKLKEEF